MHQRRLADQPLDELKTADMREREVRLDSVLHRCWSKSVISEFFEALSENAATGH